MLVKTVEAALMELTDTPATVKLGFWGNSVKQVSLLQCGQIAEKPFRLCSRSGSRNRLVLPKRHDEVFFFAANKKNKTILKLFWVLLMLSSRIIDLIWRAQMIKLFSFLATAIKERVAEHVRPIFGAKLKAWILFPLDLNVPRWGCRGNKTHCFPRGQH